jgi:hypothetical protein
MAAVEFFPDLERSESVLCLLQWGPVRPRAQILQTLLSFGPDKASPVIEHDPPDLEQVGDDLRHDPRLEALHEGRCNLLGPK